MEQVRAYCERWDMLPAGALVLCAVSGGRDSMAMLHLLWTMSKEGGFSVAAAHFNHRLRREADWEEDFVRKWCLERKIPIYTGRADVMAWSLERGISVEAAARTLRYGFLEKQADMLGAARIATAHHRADNAETLLLNLMRGAGLQGLTGIPPVRGRIIRPLLETDRESIDRYMEENGIPYVEDETNSDPGYTSRNRLRLEVLPVLEEMFPGCTARLARTAELLRADNRHLQAEAETLLPPWEAGDTVTVPVPLLQKQDAAIARRLVRTMAGRLSAELTAAQTEAVLALGSGSYLDLGGGLRAVRKPHLLTISRKRALPPPQELHMGRQSWGEYVVEVSENAPAASGTTAVLSADAVSGPLTIGAWDGAGRLAVETGSRTIKRLFADRGIPVEKREEHPALYLDGRPVAVLGVAVDRAFRPKEGEGTLTVRLEEGIVLEP